MPKFCLVNWASLSHRFRHCNGIFGFFWHASKWSKPGIHLNCRWNNDDQKMEWCILSSFAEKGYACLEGIRNRNDISWNSVGYKSEQSSFGVVPRGCQSNMSINLLRKGMNWYPGNNVRDQDSRHKQLAALAFVRPNGLCCLNEGHSHGELDVSTHL